MTFLTQSKSINESFTVRAGSHEREHSHPRRPSQSRRDFSVPQPTQTPNLPVSGKSTNRKSVVKDGNEPIPCQHRHVRSRRRPRLEPMEGAHGQGAGWNPSLSPECVLKHQPDLGDDHCRRATALLRDGRSAFAERLLLRKITG